MFADIETLAHGIRHEAFKNGQRLKKISNTDSAEQAAFFNKNSLGAGMATSLTNENRSKRNSINSFQNAITYMQSQKGALSHADELFTRMRELAHEASSGMISQKQRDILSNEFNALKGFEKTLMKYKPKLSIEVTITGNERAIFFDFLQDLGYKLFKKIESGFPEVDPNDLSNLDKDFFYLYATC